MSEESNFYGMLPGEVEKFEKTFPIGNHNKLLDGQYEDASFGRAALIWAACAKTYREEIRSLAALLNYEYNTRYLDLFEKLVAGESEKIQRTDQNTQILKEVEELRAENEALRERRSELEAKLEKLEAELKIKSNSPKFEAEKWTWGPEFFHDNSGFPAGLCKSSVVFINFLNGDVAIGQAGEWTLAWFGKVKSYRIKL